VGPALGGASLLMRPPVLTLVDMPIIETVNGFNIRKVVRPIGFFYPVEGTGRSFRTIADARAFIARLAHTKGVSPVAAP
jgi:hypothetical protein